MNITFLGGLGMLSEMVIKILLLLCVINPFFFVFLKRKRLAIVNAVLLFFCGFFWIQSISYKGSNEVNLDIYMWLLFLVINLFLLVSSVTFLCKRFLLNNLSILLSSITAISFGISIVIIKLKGLELFLVVEIILLYVIPVYLLLILISSMVQLNRTHSQQQT